MSAQKGSSARAILYAFLANIGIAFAKTWAAIFTNSGSMFAEAIHSYADSVNQALLYFGLKQSQRPPNAEHPLGYAKLSYFWSFIVALLLFSVGGLVSVYEGWHKLMAPEPLSKPWVALAVLGVAVVLETFSLLGALREIRKLARGRTVMAWVRTTRNAELVVVLGEDCAALTGLALAFVFVLITLLTGNPAYDAIGSIQMATMMSTAHPLAPHRAFRRGGHPQRHRTDHRGRSAHRRAPERDYPAVRSQDHAGRENPHAGGFADR